VRFAILLGKQRRWWDWGDDGENWWWGCWEKPINDC